jgi:hypothetical protein
LWASRKELSCPGEREAHACLLVFYMRGRYLRKYRKCRLT